MIPFICNVQKRQVHGHGRQISGCLGLGARGREWGVTASGDEVSFEDDENVLKIHCGCITLQMY